ncbi:MAG TPA: DUF6153 family protein [Microlunatus sp.]|nr:DUF6153 family protein [Microlunatus sp.]
MLLAVVAIALSLLAMHQLSGDHTAAAHRATSAERADAGMQGAAISRTQHRAESNHTHIDNAAGKGDDRRSHDVDCPGCGDHPAMTATCLAALSLLTVGGCLVRPGAWRGVRLPRPQPRRAGTPPRWTRRPLSLAELSISRT